MASATTRPTFSLHHLSPPKPPLKPNYIISPPQLKTPTLTLSPLLLHKRNHHILSIDVSKEDKPTSEEPPTSSPPPPTTTAEDEEEEIQIDKRKLEEKFAVLNTGIYECKSCGYKYDESVGDPSYPIPPGFQFGQLPEDWRCPTCGASKSFFESKMVEIAGFAQNQQFGFGANTLTSGQKGLLIYGSLLLFFGLFLGGYFIQ